METQVNPAQRDVVKVLVHCIILLNATFHSIYVLYLLTHHLTPKDHGDFGFILVCVLLILYNVLLFYLSKIFGYCFWHRQPAIFSVYYEFSRILWDLDILGCMNAAQWNVMDGIVLFTCFFWWLMGIQFMDSKLKQKYKFLSKGFYALYEVFNALAEDEEPKYNSNFTEEELNEL